MTSRAKADAYLVDGRLVVLIAGPGRVAATCRGDGVTYRVGWDLDRGWRCDCPARSRCAHLVALGAVVDIGTLTGGRR